MGKSKRFGNFEFSHVPGPGLYKIPGFTDQLLKKLEKKLNSQGKNINKLTNNELRKEMGDMMDILEENELSRSDPMREDEFMNESL